MKTKEKNWEDEFDEKFPVEFTNVITPGYFAFKPTPFPGDIKQFIKKLLEKESLSDIMEEQDDCMKDIRKERAEHKEKMKEMSDKMIGKAQDTDEADRLVKESKIMPDWKDEDRYSVCISRVYGYNQKRQEIINISKKYV